MTPKFSAIIPVYNGAAYIAHAIDSVLAQDTPVHQVIVIDDGSTDETPQILARYGDRIQARRIKNSGAAAARNAAIEMASGDYLAFLDSDDFWFRHKITTMLPYIRQYPEIGLFSSDFIVRYAHLGRRLVRHYSTLERSGRLNFDAPMREPPFQSLLHANFVGTPSGIVTRKDMVRRVGEIGRAHV